MPDHTAIPVPEARRRGLQARRALTATQRRERSEAIVQRLLDLPELAGGGNAAWYLALPDEVDLSTGVAQMRARGWRLHLPRLTDEAAGSPQAKAHGPGRPESEATAGAAAQEKVVPEKAVPEKVVPDEAQVARMSFVEWRTGAPLSANRFGIGEVEGDPVDLCDLGVVVVPCVALDEEGNRVGFGAGYYDEALGDAGCPSGRPIRIGVAFGVQLLNGIQTRPWDQVMDVVVTDSGTHRLPTRSGT